jgi:ribosomal protein S18 acetylase RimI-like enzyme/uncharacterized membrane protein
MSLAQEQLNINWVGIVVEVLSIIQGLAFNDLVSRFPEIYEHWRTTGDYLLIAHFLLSFILLLRIFQTYLTAALDYNLWTPRLFDVLVIFIIGSLEYFVFSSLTVENFDVSRFHQRLSLISLFGIIGYVNAIRRVKEETFSSYRDYIKDMQLQAANIAGVLVVLAASTLIVIFPQMSVISKTLLALTTAMVLGFNIYYSLKNTFATRVQIPTSQADVAVETAARSNNTIAEIEVIIRQAEREDVLELCDHFIRHFGYYYTAIFDTSIRLAKRIIKRILLANWGRHAFGYREFNVACDNETGSIVGLCMLKTKQSSYSFSIVAGVFFSALVVLWYIGIVGFIRTIRNLRTHKPAMPPIAADELRIVYIAVNSQAQRRKIGSQIVDYAFAIARSRKKRVVTLEVREANKSARQFFKLQGFVESEIVKAPGDDILELGARVRMVAEV